MKTTRKLLAFLMVIAMVMAMAVTASAATITVPTGTDYDYEVYQMATYETPGPGNNGYKVNSEWQDIAGEVFDLDTNGYITGWKTSETETTFITKLQTWLQNPTNYANVASTKVDEADLDNVARGYYVMVSVGSSGNLEKVAATTIKTFSDNITLTEKNATATGLPKITKTMENDGNHYLVGEVREFTIVVTTNVGDEKYVITDTMTGLELVAGSIQVDCSDPKAKAPVITSNVADFTVTVEYDGASSSFETITITYQAKVTEAGVNAIANTAQVKNQADEGPGAVSVDDSNSEFTVTKTDEEGNPLAGAEFKLYINGDPDDTAVPVKGVDTNGDHVVDYYRPVGVGETADDAIVAGKAVINGLATGTDYTLEETKAPAGYEAISGAAASFKAGTTPSAIIENKPIDPLPETGGMGTTLFYTLGGLMVMAAAVLLVTKKRMAVQ